MGLTKQPAAAKCSLFDQLQQAFANGRAVPLQCLDAHSGRPTDTICQVSVLRDGTINILPLAILVSPSTPLRPPSPAEMTKLVKTVCSGSHQGQRHKRRRGR